MSLKKRILIAPLDWGLGHATRCIPIIKLLLQHNVEVMIAADKNPLELLKSEFPQLAFIQLPGYEIAYPTAGNMIWSLLLQLPKLILRINKEHKLLAAILKENKIDLVISDNRYGLWSKNIPCVFISHQLWIQSSVGEAFLHRIVKHYLKKYTECWVPDVKGVENLSGKLSHTKELPKNTHFIGTLSRFNKNNKTVEEKYDLLVLLSGPEPQRSIFEKLMLSELSKSTLKCLVLRGLPSNAEKIKTNANIEVLAHLNSTDLNKAILASKLIISRPGYSTIMDLATLEKKAIFIPTPGQTEQEYLAKKLTNEKVAYSISQNKFKLTEALRESKNYSGFTQTISRTEDFENILKKLLV